MSLLGKVKYATTLFFLTLLSSCGYRWQTEPFSSYRPSIAVPFILGDEEGLFAHEIVRALTVSGLANVSLHATDYRLQVKILRTAGETIGFRKDRQTVRGSNQRNMVAAEGRKILAIEATLLQGDTDEVAFGPYELEADTDFDYIDGDSYQDLTFVDPSGVTRAVLPFSLGQLEPCEAAKEAATPLLYSRLAQKIVDVISSQWYQFE